MRKALMAKGLRVKRGYLGDGGIVGARWKAKEYIANT